MGLRSVDLAKGGAAVARLGAGFLCSAAGPPGRPSYPQWPSTAPMPTGSTQRPAPRPRWQLSSPARGSVLASCSILVVSVRFLSFPAGPDPGEGVSAPTLRSGSSPPFAWPPSSSLPAGDPWLARVAHASHVSHSRWPAQPSPREDSPLSCRHLSLLRARVAWPPSSHGLSRDRPRPCTLRSSARSLLWPQLPLRPWPSSGLLMGAPSSGGRPWSRVPPRQLPSLSAGLPLASLVGDSPVPAPSRR